MSARELITEHLELWTGAVTQKATRGRGSNGKIELTGIKKLRELILELAVQGKLVEQNVDDESAPVFLQKICNIRKSLIDQKKIKNTKPLTPVSSEESPSTLPSGWTWTRLGSLAEISPRNSTEDYTEASFVSMPLVTTSYHGEHGSEIRPWSEIKKGYTHFADDDIGLAKITPCFENSKAAIFKNLSNGVGAGTTELHVARPLTQDINPYFILLFLKSPRFLSEGERVMTGSAGQKRVPKSYFASTPLPFPPKEEQHRIVQKVDELMALCDRLEQQTGDQLEAHETLVDTLLGTLTQSENATELADNWARLAAHFDTLFTTEQSIDKLKQTILQLAVMGRLVGQDVRDESATAFLQRFGIKSKLSFLHGWAKVALGDFGEIIGGSTPSKAKAEFWDGSIPWVSPKDMKVPLILDSQDRITEKVLQETTLKTVPAQSILMVVRGMILAHSFPVAIAGRPLTINQDMKALIPPKEISTYILLYLQASRPSIVRLVERSSHGTCKLLSKTLWSQAIHLPPLEEQIRIGQKVDKLMTLCDQLKGRLNQACETRHQLATAIVDKSLL